MQHSVQYMYNYCNLHYMYTYTHCSRLVSAVLIATGDSTDVAIVSVIRCVVWCLAVCIAVSFQGKLSVRNVQFSSKIGLGTRLAVYLA